MRRTSRALAAVAGAALLVGGMTGPAVAKPVTKQAFVIAFDLNGDPDGAPVVASGAINATGFDDVVSDTQDTFVFPDGTLTIVHAPVRSREHFNDKNCKGQFTETGTYVISGGTGDYTGVTGSGDYRVVGRFDCAAPISLGTITARGSINLPSL